MTDEDYDKLKEHRDEFVEAFRGYDESNINKVLDELPSNQTVEDENNKSRRIFEWKDCPLKITAGYYANNKVLGEEMPIPDIDELKKILND